jgi:hypothetical protein
VRTPRFEHAPKYGKLTREETVQFHAVRCLWHALVSHDFFEAYRQSVLSRWAAQRSW